MRRAVFLFSLIMLISACGDRAPSDSKVTGPVDNTDTLAFSSKSTNVIFRSIDFQVRNPDGQVRPDVEIEFFAGGNAFLSDFNAVPLSNPGVLKTKTDDLGIGRVSATIPVPGCTGTTAIVVTGSVLGTVGSASHLWKATLTRTCTP